jgi:hypothetical protein
MQSQPNTKVIRITVYLKSGSSITSAKIGDTVFKINDFVSDLNRTLVDKKGWFKLDIGKGQTAHVPSSNVNWIRVEEL